MTPAEFKTIREGLGLNVPWLAERFEVSQRTVYYWESGSRRVPKLVAEWLLATDARMKGVLEEWDQAVTRLIAESPEKIDLIAMVRYAEDEDLWRYQPEFKPFPATCHAALLYRLRLAIEAKGGIKTRMRFMLPEQYEEWLGGREDSPALRAEWAASG